MSVSRILYYRTIKQNNMEKEYILVRRGSILSFYGREKQSGAVTHVTHLAGLVFSARYFVEFLDLCVKSDTSPRMVEELMWEYFSSRPSKKEKTDA